MMKSKIIIMSLILSMSLSVAVSAAGMHETSATDKTSTLAKATIRLMNVAVMSLLLETKRAPARMPPRKRSYLTI